MIEERLAWEFESAPIREQLRLRNRPPVPFERDILEREPPFDETVYDLLRALDELGTCRTHGLDISAIPITAVWSYWERKGYDPVTVEILTSATLAGDRKYLALRAAKKGA